MIPLAALIVSAVLVQPPAAFVQTSSGVYRLHTGSYCWGHNPKVCATALPPRCQGKPRSPRIIVRRGELVRFRLGFQPTSIQLGFFENGKPLGRGTGLHPVRQPSWRVKRVGAFSLFVKAKAGGDVSYGGCFVRR